MVCPLKEGECRNDDHGVPQQPAIRHISPREEARNLSYCVALEDSGRVQNATKVSLINPSITSMLGMLTLQTVRQQQTVVHTKLQS